MWSVLLVGLLLFIPWQVWSTTRYAAPSGTANCNNSTTNGPYINGANAGIACTQSGDTLILKSGTYEEALHADDVRSGTSSNPTTIKSEVLHGAIFLPRNDQKPASSHIGGKLGWSGTNGNIHWVVLDGYVLDGSNVTSPPVVGTGFTSELGAGDLVFQNIEIRNFIRSPTGDVSIGLTAAYSVAGVNVVFRNIYVHDISYIPNLCQGGSAPCLCADGSVSCFGYGIYLSSGGVILENSEFARTGGYAVHGYSGGGGVDDNIIRNNYFHDLQGAPMLICNNRNKIYNNILVNSGKLVPHNAIRGSLYVGGACSSTAHNNEVYNNTIINNSTPESGACIEIHNAATNNIIRNNICWQNANDAVRDWNGANTKDTNLCLGTLGVDCNLYTDPQLTSSFRLTSTSPARNQGLNLSNIFTTDIDGETRPTNGSWDLGADQFAGSLPPPITTLPAPSNLQLISNTP